MLGSDKGSVCLNVSTLFFFTTTDRSFTPRFVSLIQVLGGNRLSGLAVIHPGVGILLQLDGSMPSLFRLLDTA